MKITIARALKLKNRLQARIRTIAQDMQHYNSTVLGGTKEVNIQESLTEYRRLVRGLVELKTAVFISNQSIYNKILTLAEAKAEIKVLRALDTQHGKVVDRYATEAQEYEASLRKADVEAATRVLEDKVDELQEELDAHNHTNFIEIESIKF